jgi:hypothetical protein
MTLKEHIANYAKSKTLVEYKELFNDYTITPTDENLSKVRKCADSILKDLGEINPSQIDRIMGFSRIEYTRFEFYGGRGLVLEFRPEGTTCTYLADLNAVTLK